MSNCALSFLRGIWSFIMGSLRIIFFFFCLLFIIVQLCILILLTRHSFNINDIQLPTLTPGSSEYLRLLFMLFLSLLGAYGAFYKHAASIKMYALLSALSAVIFIASLNSGPSPDISLGNKIFFKEMARLMPEYDLNLSHGSSRANRKWDNLQHLYCCGLKGPSDWLEYNGGGDIYPNSCCFKPLASFDTCTRHKGLIEVGCIERVNQIERFFVLIEFGLIIIQLFSCLIACILSCNFHTSDSPACCQNFAHANSIAPPECQQFYGSIYVRQPPPNEVRQPPYNGDNSSSAGNTNKNLTSYYPNIREVEITAYSSPPPGYSA